MLTKTLACTALAATLAACTVTSPATKVRRGIIGGEPAPDGAYPEVVALVDKANGDPGEYFCSATLVSPTVVISAAHCVTDWHGTPYAASEIGVYIGNDALSVPLADLVPVAAVHVPTTYPFGDYNAPTGIGRDDDISVLMLATPVTTVTPALVLPVSDVGLLAPDTPALIVGFGDTTLDNTGPTGTKYFATSPIGERTDYEIIVGAPTQPDTCYGDSGGPAFLVDGDTRILFGITSRATDNSSVECGDGTISTLVTGFADWIAGLPETQLDGGTYADGGTHQDAGTPADGSRPADAATPADGPGPQGDSGLAADGGPAGSDGGPAGDGGQGGGGGDSSSCGCSARPVSGSGAALGLGLLALALRRRRN